MLAQEKYTTTADNLFAASQMMPVVADAMTVKASQGALKRGADGYALHGRCRQDHDFRGLCRSR